MNELEHFVAMAQPMLQSGLVGEILAKAILDDYSSVIARLEGKSPTEVKDRIKKIYVELHRKKSAEYYQHLQSLGVKTPPIEQEKFYSQVENPFQ